MHIPALNRILVIVALCIVSIPLVYAQEVSVQTKIDQKAQDIQALEKEIAAYEKEISALSSQASSLSSTIQSLDLTKKKLTSQIKLTEDKITATRASILSLGGEIVDAEQTVAANRRSIRSALSAVNTSYSDLSVLDILLSSRTIGLALSDSENLGVLNGKLVDDINQLEKTKNKLTSKKTDKEKAQTELNTLRSELNGQKDAIASAVAEKNQILSETKQSQVVYQRVLSEKKALKEAFEQEMLDYESALNMGIAPSDITKVGKILSYPLQNVRITQYFGNTSFSTANPQVYKGKGHTGVDFGASIGTPIFAARSGTVIGLGNTDLYKRCYSYGKWIMVKHDNGLSTLYAHLSSQKVAVGDTVNTGSVIGYSGNTGYSTGPHLHFGVYASSGVVLTKFTNSKNCQGATIPIADFSAYLNPLSYL